MEKILDVFEVYAESDKKKVSDFNNKIESTMDVKIESTKTKAEERWIDIMEETVEYLDNILRTPTRLIINEEEVVKIEKIKKVTVESIKHLSKNAGFIEDIDENGDVQPGKLLNVFKEETYNTYENRFVYTLIQKMLTIIKKEKKKIQEKGKTINKEFKRMEYTGKSYNGKNKIDMQFVMTASQESDGADAERKNQIERIKELEKKVVNLTLTQTYQALVAENVIPITPPLKKTNALLKNVNLQYAVKLWDFLINEMDTVKVGAPENKTKEYRERGKSKKYADETFLLNYLILSNLENPELTNEHKQEIIEQLIANVVEKTIDVNQEISEQQLKDLVAKQYTIIKYKRQLTSKEVQEIFKKHISRYVQKISNI